MKKVKPDTTKKIEQVRQEVGDIFNEWLDKLLVVGYAVYVILPGDLDWENRIDTSFTVKRVYPYKQIHLFVSEDSLKYWEEKKKNLKQALLHEAVHMLLSDYTELAEKRYIGAEQLHDAEETLVDHITNMLKQNWS